MQVFHVTAYDKEDGLNIRLANRDAHLAWIGTKLDQIKMAGPMLTDDGQTMIGSVLVIKAESRAALDALLAEDPYAKAGLFAKVIIRPFKWVIGAPEGL